MRTFRSQDEKDLATMTAAFAAYLSYKENVPMQRALGAVANLCANAEDLVRLAERKFGTSEAYQ